MRNCIACLVLVLAVLFSAPPVSATLCVPGKKPPEAPPSPPPPPPCEPKICDKCSHSPCNLSTGMYIDDFVDMQVPTAGMYAITVSRRYDSSQPADGPLGVGWSSSLTARLYYAAYLLAVPNTYSYEADVVMPDGVTYRFTTDGSGTFTPPAGSFDTLVRNADGTYSLTLQHTRSVYRFLYDGTLDSLIDDYGNTISYIYNAGRLASIADGSGSGRHVDLTWGPSGRLASVADNAGRIIKYFFDASDGTLTSFSDPVVSSDPSTRTSYYSYITGRFGPVLSHVEDRWHRVITDLEWYPNGKLKSYTEGSYDSSISGSSTGEKYVYTYFPSAPSVNKANSLGSSTYTYDSTGLVNDQALYDSTTGQALRAVTGTGVSYYSYDTHGNVTSMTNESGTWTYTYDTNFPDKVAKMVSSSNFAGWAYEYNPPGTAAAGALAAIYRLRSDKTTKDKITAYTYDAKGRVASFTDDNGLIVATYTYDSAGNLATVKAGNIYTTSYTYDSIGRRTAMTSPDGQVTTYTWDALGRITSVTLPKPTPSSPLNFVVAYSYDNYDATSGLVFTNVTDPNGRVTKTGYDSLGHVVQTIDSGANVTQFTYQYGLLAKITDANGNVITQTYNSDRDLVGASFPDGTTETYIPSSGVISSKVDRRGQTVTYTYDGLNRRKAVQYSYSGLTSPGGFVGQTYTYDGQNLTQVSDQQPDAVTQYSYTYDSSWRLTTETVAGGEQTALAYATGPVTPVTWAGSLVQSYAVSPAPGTTGTTQTVSYGYDPLGRVMSILWSWAPNQLFLVDYLPNGRYSRIAYPNGQSRNFTYDNLGRVTNLTNKDVNGGTLASFAYAYDYDWATSTYTMLGQRSSMTVTSVPGTNLPVGLTKYQYDSRYQLVRADSPSGYDTWSYDAIGNRTSSRFSTYTYYKNGSNPLNGQRLRAVGTSPDMAYDSRGNLTGYLVAPNTYTWDYASRLASYLGTSYTYDYMDRRKTATTSSSATTRYISLGANTIGERNPTLGVANDYVFGPGVDEPLAKRSANGTISYYGVDALGSVVLVTDANGNVTDSSAYDSWGVRGGGSELFGFTGRETAPGSLWYYRARYYDSNTGRFVSEDPLQQHLRIASFGTYIYAENNPVKYGDPFGLWCKTFNTLGAKRVYFNSLPHWTGWSQSDSFDLPHDLEQEAPLGQQASWAGGYKFGPKPGPPNGGIWPIFPQECIWTRRLLSTAFWKRKVTIHTVCVCPFDYWDSDGGYQYGKSLQVAILQRVLTQGASFLGIATIECPEPSN